MKESSLCLYHSTRYSDHNQKNLPTEQKVFEIDVSVIIVSSSFPLRSGSLSREIYREKARVWPVEKHDRQLSLLHPHVNILLCGRLCCSLVTFDQSLIGLSATVPRAIDQSLGKFSLFSQDTLPICCYLKQLDLVQIL